MNPRVRDFVLYVAIGTAVVLLLVLWFFAVPTRFHFPVNRLWLLFGCNTALLWCLLAQAFWHERRSRALWLTLALCLVVHTSVHAMLFRVVRPWPWIVFLWSMPAEGMAITYLVATSLHMQPRFKTRSGA